MKESDLKHINDLHLVHQIVYLMNEFPGKTINDFANTFLVPEMPIFTINTTVWRARDLGYITIDDPEANGRGSYKVLKTPKEWRFGERIDTLLDSTPYLLKNLNDEESDVAEGQLQAWYSPVYTRYEYGIALRKLENEKIIAEYEVKTVQRKAPSKKGAKRGKGEKIFEDTYKYYTLFENLEQLWGRKQHPDQSILE